MSTELINYFETIKKLPDDSFVAWNDVSWEEYEDILLQVGEASGLRISYDNGTLQVMTLSSEHEHYVRFIESLMTTLRLRLRLNILSFGSATMKKKRRRKGSEPDACFYVRNADALGSRIRIDFETDPPPDIVVEVDIHHDSSAKFPIYAALGVSEIWRYDGKEMTIYHLQQDYYVATESSLSLPFLTSLLLTQSLDRLSREGDLPSLLAFDEWLQSLTI